MKQITVQNQVEETSDILKKWDGNSAIIHNTGYNHKRVLELIENASPAPDGFPDKLWRSASGVAQWLRENGIPCRVIRGNGSTEPASGNAKNYFTIERYHNTTNKIYLNYAEDEENIKKIIRVFEAGHISFVYGGTKYDCFTITFDKDGKPE